MQMLLNLQFRKSSLFRNPASRFVAALLVSCLVTVPVSAGPTITLTATGSGWIYPPEEDNPNPANSGSFVGLHNHSVGMGNDWFAFALPNTSSPIVGATLSIWNDSRNVGFSPSAIFLLHRASSFTHDGLEDGPVLGSIPFSDANTGVSHYVSISLNSTGISFLNSSEGGRFVFGGSESGGGFGAFGWTSGNPAATLSLDITPIPEPETYTLMVLSLGLLGLALRRKQTQA